jgi:cellulose 1,4-beta-cellobiosidase
MDTSRNGVLGVRKDWLQWCNVVGAGIGIESTSDTGDNMIDTFAWIKNPGASDGTSDKSSTSYSSLCASEQGKSKRYIPYLNCISDSVTGSFAPSPEAGEWSSLYFQMLLRNANTPQLQESHATNQ